MPQYAILIYEKELPGGIADIPPDVMAANLAVEGKLVEMGVRMVNQQALQPVRDARTIHKGGMVTDGPFLESKEVIAGFFVIEARDMDQALEVGRLLPIMDGAVEIRPLLEI